MKQHPGHVIIEAVDPAIDCGRHPVKRVQGQPCVVEARIFRDGPEVLRAAVRWRRKSDDRAATAAMSPVNPGLDLWRGEFPLAENTRYLFTVEAWTDHFATWVDELRRKVRGGRTDLASEVAEGRSMLEAALANANRADADADAVRGASAALGKAGRDWEAALSAVDRADLVQAMTRLQTRTDLAVSTPELEIVADRPRAVFGSWYELFPRSQTTDPKRHGTFADTEKRLPAIARMGFDVIYLPPIHPIGKTNRKGKNNALVAAPEDPGSPWAIGNEHGGHTGVEPSLGTLGDFERLVTRAREHGIDIALDFAIQCSPDHPWVKEHPEWFKRRPDGTIKYAENPPKKYEDIHPVDFDSEAWPALWAALRDAMQFWVDRGVKVFRVDNPHTKPLPFWRWAIEDIQSRHPDVIFLAEAFTRPGVMNALAKLGFTQSYTYFTWRNGKTELIEYMTQLAHTGMADYFRPNFFANTPDILPEYLQHGGRPAFEIRAILAATLSPTWGIYSGYELCENTPLHPGKEEYLDSEKYEIKPRDWDAPGNITPLITRLNAIRRDNPALQRLENVRFLPADSPDILFYARAAPDLSNVLLIAVNLDPHAWHECTVQVPLEEIGVRPGGRFEVHDLLSGARYDWGASNYVRLDPATGPAHVFRVEARS